MPEVLTNDIKLLLNRAVRKHEEEIEKEIDLYENKEIFFKELALKIQNDTGYKVKDTTLYKNMYIRLKSHDEKSIAYNTNYLNALSRFVNGKDYEELHAVGSDEIFKQYQKREKEIVWEDDFKYSFLNRILEQKFEENPILKFSKPVNKLSESFTENFKRKINDNRHKITDELKLLNIHKDDLDKFILAFPTFLAKNLTYRSADFNNYTIFDYLDTNEPIKLSDKKGIFTAHTLSAFSDSIALFLSLGNMLRIADIFEIENRKIMLAHHDWALLNKGIRFYKSNDDNLTHCLRYRQKLSKTLGITTDLCKPSDLKPVLVPDFEISELENICQSYEELCKYLLPEKSINSHLTSNNPDNDLNKEYVLNLLDNHENLQEDGKLYGFITNMIVRRDFKKHFEVIKSVIEHIGYISKDTFYYFLLQRYFQHYYNDNFLKIGNIREMDFDVPLRNLNLMEISKYPKMQDYSLDGIYFKDYYFDKGGYTVHPYSFPSARLMQKFPQIDETEKRAILIKDNDEEKISELVNSVSETMLANIMSDLLYFTHSFIAKTQNAKICKEIYDLLDILSFEFRDAWLVSFKKDNQFNNSIFGNWFGLRTIPYYFFPYIIFLTFDEKQPNNENTKSFAKNQENLKTVKKVYTKIIMLVLSEVRKYMMTDYISSMWGEFPDEEQI